jgi:hypothetical protein
VIVACVCSFGFQYDGNALIPFKVCLKEGNPFIETKISCLIPHEHQFLFSFCIFHMHLLSVDPCINPVSLSTLFSACPIYPLSFPSSILSFSPPSHPLPFSSHPFPTHSPCPLLLSFPPVAQLHSALEEDGLYRRARFHHGHLLGGSRRAVQGHAGRKLHGHLVRVSEIFFSWVSKIFSDIWNFFF